MKVERKGFVYACPHTCPHTCSYKYIFQDLKRKYKKPFFVRIRTTSNKSRPIDPYLYVKAWWACHVMARGEGSAGEKACHHHVRTGFSGGEGFLFPCPFCLVNGKEAKDDWNAKCKCPDNQYSSIAQIQFISPLHRQQNTQKRTCFSCNTFTWTCKACVRADVCNMMPNSQLQIDTSKGSVLYRFTTSSPLISSLGRRLAGTRALSSLTWGLWRRSRWRGEQTPSLFQTSSGPWHTGMIYLSGVFLSAAKA